MAKGQTYQWIGSPIALLPPVLAGVHPAWPAARCAADGIIRIFPDAFSGTVHEQEPEPAAHADLAVFSADRPTLVVRRRA